MMDWGEFIEHILARKHFIIYTLPDVYKYQIKSHSDWLLFPPDKPVFQSDSTTNSVPLQLEEGHKATINMTASANPTDVLYKWTRYVCQSHRQQRRGGC